MRSTEVLLHICAMQYGLEKVILSYKLRKQRQILALMVKLDSFPMECVLSVVLLVSYRVSGGEWKS